MHRVSALSRCRSRFHTPQGYWCHVRFFQIAAGCDLCSNGCRGMTFTASYGYPWMPAHRKKQRTDFVFHGFDIYIYIYIYIPSNNKMLCGLLGGGNKLWRGNDSAVLLWADGSRTSSWNTKNPLDKPDSRRYDTSARCDLQFLENCYIHNHF